MMPSPESLLDDDLCCIRATGIQCLTLRWTKNVINWAAAHGFPALTCVTDCRKILTPLNMFFPISTPSEYWEEENLGEYLSLIFKIYISSTFKAYISGTITCPHQSPCIPNHQVIDGILYRSTCSSWKYNPLSSAKLSRDLLHTVFYIW